MEEWLCGYTEEIKVRWTRVGNEWMEGWMDGWMDGWVMDYE